MSSLVKELGLKSAFSLLGQIVGYALSMLNLLLITRILGSEIYGTLVYLLSFYSIIVIIAKFGLGNTLISFLSRYSISKEDKREIVAISIWLSLILSFVLIITCCLARNFIAESILNLKDTTVFLALLPYIFLETWSYLALESLRSQKLIKENVLGKMVIMPLSKILLFLLVWFVWQKVNFWLYIIPLYFSQIVSIGYAAYFLLQEGLLSISFPLSLRLIRQLTTFSLAVLMTDIVSVIMGSIDKYMLGYMGNVADVGVYNIALVLGGVSSFALAAVNNIFAPMISSLYSKGDFCALKMIYRKATKWITIVNLLVLGIIIVFAKDIMHIAGDEFVLGSVALILVGLGQMINSAVGSVGYMNVMTGHPRYNMCSNVVAMIFNVIGNWYLIPKYGMNGAAFATAGALAVHNIMNFALMQKYLSLNPVYSKYIGLAMSFVVAIIFSYLYAGLAADCIYICRLIVGCIIYTVIFFSIIINFSLDEDEKVFILSLYQKIKKLI